MKGDEGFSNMLDKTILIDCLNENVIILTQIKIQKGQFLLPFFYAYRKNLQ
jgi:hypothetical protein